MTIFMTRDFARFVRKSRLATDDLRNAAVEVAEGRWDVSLGQGVFKQRVARRGGGKSGGFRTIVVFKASSHIFFVHAFAKTDKANVSARELKALKRLALILLGFNAEELEAAGRSGELIEVKNDGGEQEV